MKEREAALAVASPWDASSRPEDGQRVYAYALVENDPQENAPVLVDLDRDRIVFVRTEENVGEDVTTEFNRLILQHGTS